MNKAETEQEFQPEASEQEQQEETAEVSAEIFPETQTEQILDQGMDRLSAKAEGVASFVESVEKIAPGKTDQLKEKIGRIWDHSVDTVKVLAMMAAISYGPELSPRPRSAVEKKVDEKGNVVYHHSDRRTTQILDYLSGKEELPRDMRLKFVKEEMVNIFSSNSLSTPENFENLNESQLKSFMANFYGTTGKESLRDPDLAKYLLRSENDPDWIDSFTKSKFNFDPKLYKSLWEIETEVGGPRIRFGHPSDKREGSYSGASNTILLEPPSHRRAQSDAFVSEAAHAKQAKEKPFSTSVQWTKDMIRTVFRSIKTGQSLSASQEELYDIPGTVEYEAHKEIEPGLEKKLK